MTPRPRAAVTLLLLLAALATGAPAIAAAEAPPGPALANLPGFERAVVRTYTLDLSTPIAELPTAAAELKSLTGALLLVGVVAAFDTPQHAAAAVAALGGSGLGGAAVGQTPVTLRATPVTDIGGGGVHYAGGDPNALSLYVVHDGVFLYSALVSGRDIDADALARGIVAYAAQREAGTGAGEFHANGTSRGGLWAKLPDENAVDVVGGALPLIDAVITPAAGTPAA